MPDDIWSRDLFVTKVIPVNSSLFESTFYEFLEKLKKFKWIVEINPAIYIN